MNAPPSASRPNSQLVSLNALVRHMEASVALATEPRVKVAYRLYEDLDPIMADPAAVERLLLALARSAKDALPDGGTVTIETDTVFLDAEFAGRWPGMQPGAYSMLLVRDSRLARRESWGVLGQQSADLLEARKIAQEAGGHAEIEMQPGTGRICRAYFPAIDADAAGAVTPDRERGGETVLLVDDTESLRDMIQRILTGFGYKVLVARDGAQALEVSDQHHGQIDLLLSDVVMPGIGGPELAIRLRMRRPTLRVMLMSGYDEHSLASTAGGYASFIAKPFRPDVLGARIRHLLDSPAA